MKKGTKKAAEKFTVKELKALLQGIDILQGSKNWCPDQTQWDRIRAKIDCLQDEVMVESPVVVQNVMPVQQRPVAPRRGILTEPAVAQVEQEDEPMEVVPPPIPHPTIAPETQRFLGLSVEQQEMERIQANIQMNRKAGTYGNGIQQQMPGGGKNSNVVLPVALDIPSEFT